MVSRIGQSFHECNSLDGVAIYGLVRTGRRSNISEHREMEIFVLLTIINLSTWEISADLWSNASLKFSW